MRRAWGLGPMTVLIGLAGCRQLLGFEDVTVTGDGDAAVTDAGDDLPTEDGWRSGSRLKLAWNDYSGVRADLSMLDSVLGVPCIPFAWADGKRYCAPRSLSSTFEGVGYVDDQCTQRVGYRLAGTCSLENAPVFFTRGDNLPCVGFVRSQVFRRGTFRNPAPANLYVNANGTCEPAFLPAASYDIYNLLEEIPTSNLVEMTRVEVPIDGRVNRIDHRGTDGSSYAGGAFDTELDVACTVNDSGTCAPATGGTGSVFADSACTTLVSRVQAGCPAPRLGSRAQQPGCTSPTIYTGIGAKRAATPSLYQYNGTTCAATSVPADSDFYDTTAQVTPATLPRVVDPPPNGGSISVVRFGSGPERIRITTPFDLKREASCGTQGGRCLPTGVGTGAYFTDAGCLMSRDLIVVAPPPAGCAATPVPLLAVKQSSSQGSCTTTYDVYELGPKFTNPAYAGAPGACGLSSSFDLYELGALVPPTEFAAATPMIDP